MEGMFSTELTKFFPLKPLRCLLLILPGAVVSVLTFQASQSDQITHQKTPLKKEHNKKVAGFLTFIDKEYTILVGKNAKGNEKLTFTIAKGNDTWLHVTPMAGSHVVIKAKLVNEDLLQDAMQLALYFSQARKQSQAEVLITKVKYVSRTKTTGKVLVSKHKTRKVQLDLNRIKELLNKKSL